MMTFHENPYKQVEEAEVLAVTDDGSLVLSSTLFYAKGGGQPGDQGVFETADGSVFDIYDCVYSQDRSQIHYKLGDGVSAPPLGTKGKLVLNWERRFRLMRTHTALHLLSVVLPYPVTGGSIGEGEGRLDFDLADAGLATKDEVALEMNRLINLKAEVHERWITEDELDAKPELVKTMKVKPPRGNGQIRLVEIQDLDLQPCGGTHVANTEEIGEVEVVKIEKKGAMNRRVKIRLVAS